MGADKRKKDDDNAAAIAEKLLQGWTMLAEYCPMEGCLAPLMRSRDGRKYCVAHDMYVMSPEEADAMKANGGGVEGRSVGSPAPKPAPVAEEAEEPASVEPASVERIGFYQQLRAGTRSSRSADAAPQVSYSAREGAPAVGGTEDATVKTTAWATANTLALKMEEARARLANTEVTSGDFQSLVASIERLAATIKACESI